MPRTVAARYGTGKGGPLKTTFDLCHLHTYIPADSAKASEFAANFAHVLNGTALDEYAQPALFFANTHGTAGLKNLLSNVFRRPSEAGGAATSFRLNAGGYHLVRYHIPAAKPAVGGAERLRFAAGRSPLLRCSHARA